MIFIDIEMPNRCADCPCFKITRSDGEIYGHDSCQLLHLIFNEDVYYGKHIHNPFESRYEDCPLRNASDFLKTIVDRPSEDLINRADAIEALKNKSRPFGDCSKCIHTYGTLGCCTTVSNEWVYDCEHGMEHYKNTSAPSADRPQGEWIPCSEKMPNDDEWAIWCSSDGVIGIARFKEDCYNHFYPNETSFDLEDAVAWMPLPEPYR